MSSTRRAVSLKSCLCSVTPPRTRVRGKIASLDRASAGTIGHREYGNGSESKAKKKRAKRLLKNRLAHTGEGLPMGNSYFWGMPSSLFYGFFGMKLPKNMKTFVILIQSGAELEIPYLWLWPCQARWTHKAPSLDVQLSHISARRWPQLEPDG
jgi:hypothetical protein